MKITLGNNIIEDCDGVLLVNEVEVFRLRHRGSDGTLICDFDVRDKKGNRIAKISKNNVVFCAPGYLVNNLPKESNITDQNGNFIARVQEVGSDEIKITGEFWIDGFQVLITDKLMDFSGTTFSGCVISGFGKAISISPNNLMIGIR